jgi:hypothetical protein
MSTQGGSDNSMDEPEIEVYALSCLALFGQGAGAYTASATNKDTIRSTGCRLHR